MWRNSVRGLRQWSGVLALLIWQSDPVRVGRDTSGTWRLTVAGGGGSVEQRRYGCSYQGAARPLALRNANVQLEYKKGMSRFSGHLGHASSYFQAPTQFVKPTGFTYDSYDTMPVTHTYGGTYGGMRIDGVTEYFSAGASLSVAPSISQFGPERLAWGTGLHMTAGPQDWPRLRVDVGKFYVPGQPPHYFAFGAEYHDAFYLGFSVPDFPHDHFNIGILAQATWQASRDYDLVGSAFTRRAVTKTEWALGAGLRYTFRARETRLPRVIP